MVIDLCDFLLRLLLADMSARDRIVTRQSTAPLKHCDACGEVHLGPVGEANHWKKCPKREARLEGMRVELQAVQGRAQAAQAGEALAAVGGVGGADSALEGEFRRRGSAAGVAGSHPAPHTPTRARMEALELGRRLEDKEGGARLRLVDAARVDAILGKTPALASGAGVGDSEAECELCGHQWTGREAAEVRLQRMHRIVCASERKQRVRPLVQGAGRGAVEAIAFSLNAGGGVQGALEGTERARTAGAFTAPAPSKVKQQTTGTGTGTGGVKARAGGVQARTTQAAVAAMAASSTYAVSDTSSAEEDDGDQDVQGEGVGQAPAIETAREIVSWARVVLDVSGDIEPRFQKRWWDTGREFIELLEMHGVSVQWKRGVFVTDSNWGAVRAVASILVANGERTPAAAPVAKKDKEGRGEDVYRGDGSGRTEMVAKGMAGTAVGTDRKAVIQYPTSTVASMDCLVAAFCADVKDVRVLSHPLAVKEWLNRAELKKLAGAVRLEVDLPQARMTSLLDYRHSYDTGCSLTTLSVALDNAIRVHADLFGMASHTVLALAELRSTASLEAWHEQALAVAEGHGVRKSDAQAWAAQAVLLRFNLAWASWHRVAELRLVQAFRAHEATVEMGVPGATGYGGARSLGRPQQFQTLSEVLSTAQFVMPSMFGSGTGTGLALAPAGRKGEGVKASGGSGAGAAAGAAGSIAAAGGAHLEQVIEAKVGEAAPAEVVRAVADGAGNGFMWSRKHSVVQRVRFNKGELCYQFLRKGMCGNGSACARQHATVVGGKWAKEAAP